MCGCEKLFGPAREIAERIKNRIRTETGLGAFYFMLYTDADVGLTLRGRR